MVSQRIQRHIDWLGPGRLAPGSGYVVLLAAVLVTIVLVHLLYVTDQMSRQTVFSLGAAESDDARFMIRHEIDHVGKRLASISVDLLQDEPGTAMQKLKASRLNDVEIHSFTALNIVSPEGLVLESERPLAVGSTVAELGFPDLSALTLTTSNPVVVVGEKVPGTHTESEAPIAIAVAVIHDGVHRFTLLGEFQFGRFYEISHDAHDTSTGSFLVLSKSAGPVLGIRENSLFAELGPDLGDAPQAMRDTLDAAFDRPVSWSGDGWVVIARPLDTLSGLPEFSGKEYGRFAFAFICRDADQSAYVAAVHSGLIWNVFVLAIGLALCLAFLIYLNRGEVRKVNSDLLRSMLEMFDNSPNMVAVTAPDGTLVYANSRLIDRVGVSESALVGRKFSDVIQFSSGEPCTTAMLAAVGLDPDSEQGPVEVNFGHDATPVSVEPYVTTIRSGQNESLTIVRLMDCTFSQRTEEALHFLKSVDPLTSLPKLEPFEEHVTAQLAIGSSVALGILDIDDLSSLNHFFSTSAGDKVLVEVAGVLQQRITDLGGDVCRQDGDRFLFAIYNDGVSMLDVAEQLRDSIRDTVRLPEVALKRISVSIGFEGFRYGSQVDFNVSTLVERAGIALKRAIALGGGVVIGYDAGLGSDQDARLQIESDLEEALERDDLYMAYQPIFDLASGSLVGAEALVRWNHPVHGLVPPDEFIAAAERTSLIHTLDRSVLCMSLEGFNQMRPYAPNKFSISVNLSRYEFSNQSFLEEFSELVKRYDVGPGNLNLEITERQAMEDANLMKEFVIAVRSMGYGVSLDDFGTGSSSLSEIRDLDISAVKIDKSFIETCDADLFSQSVVRSISEFGQAVGFAVIAEGVESQEQVNFLSDFPQMRTQGYFYSKPLTLHQIIDLMRLEVAS